MVALPDPGPAQLGQHDQVGGNGRSRIDPAPRTEPAVIDGIDMGNQQKSCGATSLGSAVFYSSGTYRIHDTLSDPNPRTLVSMSIIGGR